MEKVGALARFVHQSRWGNLPRDVQHEASRVFVNWLGCAYGGASHPAVLSALNAVGDLSGKEECSVLGHHKRLDLLNSAFINGLSASAYAFDDTHLKSIIHPSAPTVAALLAYAQTRPVSGQQFLHAIVIANEVQCRLASALAAAPARSHIGLYLTGHTGAAGVAAGVGTIMGLTVEQLVWAMGIGACQGGGFRATYASMCSGFIPANAAKSGLFSALLAVKDFTCSEGWLETKNGFLDVFGDPPDPDAVTRDLGVHYECLDVAAKPFPAGVFSHATIDACVELAKAHIFASSDVERVDVKIYELGAGLTGRTEPRTGYDAQVSVYHWAAAALHHRKAGLSEATDACVNDPAVVELRRRVSVTVDPSLKGDEACVTVTLRNGRQLESRVGPYLGSPARPLTDEQLASKFVGQSAALLGAQRVKEVLDLGWNLARIDDVGAVSAIL